MNTRDLSSLRQPSVEEWEALCRYLQPFGHKEGHHWLAGSIEGEPGRSFDVNLRNGLFGDWATGERPQRGVINYWMAVRKVDLNTAVRELTAWLARTTSITNHQKHDPPLYPLTTPPKDNKIYFPEGLSLPSEHDLQALGRSRAIDVEALHIATGRGFIYCFDDPLNGRCWLYTDSRRSCGLRRRLDGEEFRLADGSQAKSVCCKGSDMRTPIGYQEAGNFPALGIVEGAPDAIALLAHAWASGLEGLIAPVCMPSATANFTDSALAYLQNKRARIFIDNDDAGRKAANRWATQLLSAGVVVDGFSFAGLVQTNGQPVKDLNDLLLIDYDCWEQFRTQVEDILNFAF